MSDNRLIPVTGSATRGGMSTSPRHQPANIVSASLTRASNSAMRPAQRPARAAIQQRPLPPVPRTVPSAVAAAREVVAIAAAPAVSRIPRPGIIPVAGSSGQHRAGITPSPLTLSTGKKKKSLLEVFRKGVGNIQRKFKKPEPKITMRSRFSAGPADIAGLRDILLLPELPEGEMISKVEALKTLLAHERRMPEQRIRHIDLSGVYLAGENLQGINFERVNLMRAQLNDANMTGANMSNANLDLANLRNANLTKAAMSGAHMMYARMSGANMRCTDLTRVNLETAAEFDGVDLSGSILSLQSCSLAAIVDKTTLVLYRYGAAWPGRYTGLSIPAAWTEENMDRYLNHLNNDNNRSLLQEINAIPTLYNDTKIRLARSLINSLIGTNLSTVALPILSVFYHYPYIEYPDIKASIDKLCMGFMERYRESLLPSVNEMISPALLFFAEDHQRMLTYNAPYIQTILAALNDPFYRNHAIRLYQRYLALEPVNSYQALAAVGNFEYPPDWQDTDAFNFILMASPPPSASEEETLPAIICSQKTLEALLRAENSDKWQQIFTYVSPQNYLSPQQWQQSRLLEERFGLLHKLSESQEGMAELSALLDTLFNENRLLTEGGKSSATVLKRLFQNATKTSTRRVPLTSVDSQELLNQIFSPRMDSGSTITEQHVNEILDIYHLTTADDKEKAELFLALTAIFTLYSSNQHFGEELDSPHIVRLYAYSLMVAAWRLAPDIFRLEGQDRFNQWKSILLGEGEAFTCTALLFENIREYMSVGTPACLMYLPPAWGGDARAGIPARAAIPRLTELRISAVDDAELPEPAVN